MSAAKSRSLYAHSNRNFLQVLNPTPHPLNSECNGVQTHALQKWNTRKYILNTLNKRTVLSAIPKVKNPLTEFRRSTEMRYNVWTCCISILAPTRRAETRINFSEYVSDVRFLKECCRKTQFSSLFMDFDSGFKSVEECSRNSYVPTL
jgi:hypothetical protein